MRRRRGWTVCLIVLWLTSWATPALCAEVSTMPVEECLQALSELEETARAEMQQRESEWQTEHERQTAEWQGRLRGYAIESAGAMELAVKAGVATAVRPLAARIKGLEAETEVLRGNLCQMKRTRAVWALGGTVAGVILGVILETLAGAP